MPFHKIANRKTSGRKSARKNTRAPRRKAAPKKQKSPMLFFFAGIFLTLIGVVIWLFITQPQTIKAWFKTDQAPAEQVVTNHQTQNKSSKTNGDDKQLDYHQILTNKELAVEKDPTATQPPSNRKYIMQCGASKVLEKAESMKAQIAFIGLQAKVSEKNGWYRVQLGPYLSKRAAESDRHKLQDNNFQDCRIW
ncbi:SPOR domain-containing protein [Kangiella sp. TOML190]|uniref:SPOR domain-containing protein n=1 Tax=Kangiella sp. TOML190 TaxID=2931351 RepID=UPI00203AC5D2|nr:SPOR domain-containing protein [Kangiella sp. TOML190]